MNPAPIYHPSFRGRLGVARRDISPPPGIYSRNWGAATSDVAASLHRPMTLTVLTLQDEVGGDPLALLALDLGWWRSSEEEQILARAVLEAGIKDGGYMLALSHTHAGPSFCPQDFENPGGAFIPGYLDFLATQIRESLGEALSGAQPALLEAATGKCGLATNRDLPDPQTGRLLVGLNPRLPADDTLLFGRVTDLNGRCLATVVNYACHPTILAWENSTISPDFVGAMREVVERETSAPCLFLQGASGELAAAHQYVGDPAVADQAGRSLGHAALGIFHGMLPPGQELAFRGPLESGAPLAIWKPQKRAAPSAPVRTQTLTIDHPLKPDLLSLEELQRQLAACTDRVLGERLRRQLFRRKALGENSALTRHHLVWQLGEVLFVSVPDEAYSALQLALRQTADPGALFLATVTNGSRGYLSPQCSYEADSYASGQSPYTSGCFERTVETLKTALQTFS
jgi:hypothetical protein